MRHSLLIAIALAMTFTAPAAQAGVRFAAYEGPDAIQTGQGGTKVTERGIDFWTTGSPPRKFQVLGIITDQRDDKPITRIFGGDAVGSKGVAKKVIEAGGNAVVVVDQKDRAGGLIGHISGGEFTSFGARRVTVTTTQFLVIKYLD